MNRYWISAVTLMLVLGVTGYALAQPTGLQSGMMGGNVMGGGMMNGMMNMMSRQPLTQEQIESFAQQQRVTVSRPGR